MQFSLKNHPFAVQAFFEASLVLTYAVPKEQLVPLIPKCLQLNSFEDTWAFIAVAIVKTKGLRPKRFPAFMGNDFILTGYRVFVRYTTSEGKRLRGLYILKSETNRKKMQFLGNIFTRYSYATTDIQMTDNGSVLNILSAKSDLHVTINNVSEAAALPLNSPFANWKEARRFSGPLPFTFTFDAKKNEVLMIEGVRQNWKPVPVEVTEHQVGFFRQLNLKDVVLANAFLIRNVPYYWKKGKTDTWKS